MTSFTSISRHISLPCVAAVTAMTVFFPLSSWAGNAMDIQHKGSISYVSGGIGSDETESLQSVQNDYNLRIMNADRVGQFSGNTRIVISDTKENVLLDTMGGPLFYAQVPNGRYIVEGFNGDQSKKESVTILDNKPARIRFVWAENLADRGE